ncbi:hypothetical protein M422DRAFT_246145 [Sphaerobolus stellatus SS14]|nr:hypothetical protein M422DRAFT_246145 [Sphaerobolus stellatus SS14]
MARAMRPLHLPPPAPAFPPLSLAPRARWQALRLLAPFWECCAAKLMPVAYVSVNPRQHLLPPALPLAPGAGWMDLYPPALHWRCCAVTGYQGVVHARTIPACTHQPPAPPFPCAHWRPSKVATATYNASQCVYGVPRTMYLNVNSYVIITATLHNSPIPGRLPPPSRIEHDVAILEVHYNYGGLRELLRHGGRSPPLTQHSHCDVFQSHSNLSSNGRLYKLL